MTSLEVHPIEHPIIEMAKQGEQVTTCIVIINDDYLGLHI